MYSYQFHIRDYVTRTRHLSPLEDLAYRRLLDAVYTEEAPLPCDPAACARAICLREHEAEVAAVLQEFFELTPSGWVNERANEEIAKYHAKAESARKAIKSRWENYETNTKRITDQIPTNNHKPKPSTTPKPNPAPSAQGFEAFWSEYPKRIAKAEAQKVWSKLNPDDELRARIMSALLAVKSTRDWTKEGGRFVPNATTWLNQRRWEDEAVAVEPWDEELKGAI